MRAVRSVGICLACAAAVAIGGAPTASAAKILELSTSEGALAAGTQLNVGATSLFETAAGNIECPDGLLVATLLNNNSAKDKISIEAGIPSGKNGVLCSTSTPLGSVEVAAGGLPWTEQFAGSGKATLKGHRKLQLTVTAPLLAGLQCSYEAKKISETFPVAATGVTAPLALAVSNQAFVRGSGSSAICPASIAAELSALPVTIEGPSANLLPVFVTRRVVPKT
jgi:hypothetical protein